VQKIVTSGCAANGCHGGPTAKGGSFYLFTTGDPVKTTYTNFLTLQTFHQNVDKIQQPLVNREFPEKSLLLQYMLPRNVAETPHPDVQNFKPVVKTKNDVRFQTTVEWIRMLSSVVPDYGIDLTKEPEKKQTAPGRNTR